MALPRVYDIAKELGIDTKVALAKLEELGEYVKGGSSTIAPPVAAKLRAAYPKKEKPAEKPKAEKPKPEAKTTEAGAKPAEQVAEKPADKPAEPAEKPAPLQGIPRPGNNPFSSNQGMGIPRPMARPGNNPFSSNQGMGRPRPQGAPGQAQRPGGPRPQQGGPQRPGGAPRPGGGKPGGFGAGPGGPGGAPGGGRPGAFPGRPGPGGRGGRGAGTAGAFGKGGSKSKSRKSKRTKREEFEQREAPSLGGAMVPRGDGNTVVRIRRGASIQDFADKIGANAGQLITVLFHLGQMATATASLDEDTFQILGEELGYKVELVSPEDEERELYEGFGLSISTDIDEEDSENLSPRPPVVTVMGHVDHGKTSLLDAIRQANVVSGEAGGITQHIGAYQVTAPDGSLLSFLDTPGHAAFTSMRARGAQVTDIVVLVVAADDSVMPQTIEAINHAKAAKVPMIVAINKCDKPDANPDIVRTELLQHEVIVEAMSGDVQDVEVSALAKTGLDQLLEAISLQSEILELKANPKRAAQGAVIEAQLDVGRGPVATVLVQKGTLKQGDIFVVGEQWGKVRALINDKGERVKEAGPSVPVEVLGLNGAPEAGDVLNVVDTEAQAREIADYRIDLAKEKRAAAGAATTLEQLMARAKENENLTEMPILVKADVQGSAEAIVQAMEKIGNDEVRVRVLHYGVGAITDTDVGLAEASGAPVIGFNVRANASARNSANQKGVEIRYYSIIYDLVDDVRAAATGLLSAEIRENFIGYAQIKEVFKVSGVGKVAGCIVTEGVARRSAGVRLLRDNVVIHEGTLKTLKRFKDEVKDVQSGQECGMAFENYDDIRPNDVIEIFEREEVARTLD